MAHFAIPSHVLVGSRALYEALPYMKKFGDKALIVTGKHVGRSPMAEQLKDLLAGADIMYEVYDGVTGEPTEKMIEEGLSIYRNTGCRFVIGIGGGSPLDTAKAVAVMSVNEGRIADYNGTEITGDLPGIIAVPTTAGTGSEATKFTVITDSEKDVKMLLKGDCLIPDVAVINSAFTMDMPKSVTAMTGLDALTHAVEAYTSKKASPLTDVYAVSAVKRIMKYLPLAYRNGFDSKAREQMSLAAYEAGVCINNSSVTLVHGMSRPIGAMFHVPHGLSNAMLLGVCLRFALDGARQRFADLGRAVGAADASGSDETAAGAFLEKTEELCGLCRIPGMKEYGIGREEYDRATEKMAEDAIASGSPEHTRKPVTKEDCISMYQQAFMWKREGTTRSFVPEVKG